VASRPRPRDLGQCRVDGATLLPDVLGAPRGEPTALGRVAEARDGAVDGGQPVGRDVENGGWDAVLVKADRWQTILSGSPFNFEQAELALE